MKEIPCRVFKAQVADWKSNRLSGEQAQRMADHLCRCTDCTREAQAEEQIRKLWSAAPAATADVALWTQVARRLEPAPSRKAFPLRFAPEWMLAGAVTVTVFTVFGLWMEPKGGSQIAPLPTPAPRPAPHAPAQDTSWTVLPDVAHVDPAVDDPAGAATERVWNLVEAHQAEAQ